MSRKSSHGHALLLVLATACWGAGTVVTKQVLTDVGPLTLLPLQLAASCLFLAAATRIGRARLSWSPQMTRLTLLGVLNPGLAYALGLLGLATVSASLSVLLWAAEPILILVLAVAVLRERVTVALASAIGVAAVGVLLVVYRPDVAGDTAGVVLTSAAVGTCALYTVLTRRLLVDDDSLVVVLVQQTAALCFAVAVATTAESAGRDGWSISSVTAATLAGAALSGVLYYGGAFWLYLAGLRRVAASTAGAFLPLIPVFGLSFAYTTGERLDPTQWLGAALIVGATIVVASRQAAPIDNPDPVHER